MKKRIALLLCLALALTAVTSTALADFHWPWEKPGSGASETTPAPEAPAAATNAPEAPVAATNAPETVAQAPIAAATGAFYDMTFTLEGDAYALPMPYRTLAKNGWQVGPYEADPETQTIGGEKYATVRLMKKNATVWVDLYNLGTSEIKLADCTVGEIRIDAATSSFDIAGITDTTTEAQVVARLGAGKVGTSDDDGPVHSYDAFSGVAFVFNPKGVMQRVGITRVYPAPEYAPTKVQNALMAAYRAPIAADFVGFETVQTLLVTRPVFELFGTLYELPTPLGAFMADGWKLFDARTDGVVSGRDWTDAYLYRGDSLLELRCYNPSDSAVHISDCVAVGVGSTFVNDAVTSESTFAGLRLPGGIETGLTLAKAKALFGDSLRVRGNGKCELSAYTENFETEIELQLFFDLDTGTLAAMGMKLD